MGKLAILKMEFAREINYKIVVALILEDTQRSLCTEGLKSLILRKYIYKYRIIRIMLFLLIDKILS